MIDSDEIKQRIDIVEYISRYTPLNKAGRQYKGLCPFHTEKTPSFYVYPDEGRWHCYGACSEGGDIFSFLMKKESVGFVDALTILGREVGIDVDEARGLGSSSARDSIFEINTVAEQYFRSTLLDSPGATEARAYLLRRGIDSETAEHFRIGFSPDGWTGLRDFLYEKGYDYETQFKAGVLKHNEETGRYYDAFRNRVVVPIRDRTSRIIGFGGRVLDDSQPKYLNTAETPVFKKSHAVFGIDIAREAIRNEDRVVIVEGYMDVIAAHQFGYENTVACMGTAITPEQLQQIQRLTKRYVFALDADSAGQKATLRGLNQARLALVGMSKPIPSSRGFDFEQRLSAELYIASMPEGMDPDDVVRQDPEQWKALIEDAQPLVDYFFAIVSKNHDLKSAAGKTDAVSVLAPLIAELPGDIQRQHYVQMLSRLVEIDEMIIGNSVSSAAKTRSVSKPKGTPSNGRAGGYRGTASAGGPSRQGVPPMAEEERSPLKDMRFLEKENYLLANLLIQPKSIYWLTAQAQQRDLVPPEQRDWQHVENREIFRAIKQFLAGDEQWDIELFNDRLDEPLRGRLGRLLAAAAGFPQHDDYDEVRKDMLKVLVRMRIDSLKSKYTAIKFIIADAQREGDIDAIRSFYKTNSRNLLELNHLQNTLTNLTLVLVQQRSIHHGMSVAFR